MNPRERLPSRRASTTFDFECADLRYVCSYSCYADGRIGELFLGNHKSNSAADTSARDAAITFSIAVQHGADPEAVRRALCRDSNGKANGPLGTALDLRAIARALGGEVSGRRVLAPGPQHSPKDRSLCVSPPGSGVQRCALAGEHEHRTVRTATAAPLGCAPPILGADPGGVRRRQQPEAQIQRAVFQHFRARGAPGVFALHPANGGFRRPVEAAILKGLGVRAGVPDLIACRGGRFYALELKTDTGKLSDAQEQVLAALREAGAEVAVTYGLDAALAQLERWQLLRGVAS